MPDQFVNPYRSSNFLPEYAWVKMRRNFPHWTETTLFSQQLIAVSQSANPDHRAESVLPIASVLRADKTLNVYISDERRSRPAKRTASLGPRNAHSCDSSWDHKSSEPSPVAGAWYSSSANDPRSLSMLHA